MVAHEQSQSLILSVQQAMCPCTWYQTVRLNHSCFVVWHSKMTCTYHGCTRKPWHKPWYACESADSVHSRLELLSTVFSADINPKEVQQVHSRCIERVQQHQTPVLHGQGFGPAGSFPCKRSVILQDPMTSPIGATILFTEKKAGDFRDGSIHLPQPHTGAAKETCLKEGQRGPACLPFFHS